MLENSDVPRRDILRGMPFGVGIVLGLSFSKKKKRQAMLASQTGGQDPSFLEKSTLGEWDTVVTNDWDSVMITKYPTIAAHLDKGLVVFSDGETHRQRIELGNTTMKAIITNDMSKESVDMCPTIIFESGDPVGELVLFQEGDL